MRAISTIRSRSIRSARPWSAPRLTIPRLAFASVGALALALFITACENVSGYTQPTLARVIDASSSPRP